jgi:UDP-N-acetylglucosamine--N-acetylmuramyl-(pentapeptide) pyrophosphoryl-undecaprenol N-acetylglucosamine transferase
MKTLLVLGGSQGARSINRTLVEALPEMAKLNVQVLHVCGERDYDRMYTETTDLYPFYKLIPYMYNVWDGLAAADVVVSRAGATAISEILARGIPSVLIPFPFSSEGHQDHNAKLLSDAGAAVLVNDRDLTKERLLSETARLLNDKELYARMQSMCKTLTHPNASIEIVNVVYGMLKMEMPGMKKKQGRRSKKNAA